ncbi:MAG: Ig-like domain-containing protein [Lachnospiraceae bacterium]|nr:Ig-like domain-containing protein [Lachnospiraceae bacterium]
MHTLRKLFSAFALLFVSLILLQTDAVSAASEPSVKLGKKNYEADINETFTVKVKTKNLDGFDIYYSVSKITSDGSDEYEEYFSNYACEEKKNGKYRFTIFESGTYTLTFTVYEEADGFYLQSYQDSSTVTINNIGPEKRKLAVLIDSTQKISIDRGEFVSAEAAPPKQEEDPFSYDSDDYFDFFDYFFFDDDPWGSFSYPDNYEQGEVLINGDEIKGIKEGRVLINVTWKDQSGKTITDEIVADVTDPAYTPYEGYILVDHGYIYPTLSHCSEYSEILLSSDNEKICAVERGSFSPISEGECTLTITVDGRSFTDKIHVYDPQLSETHLLIKKKKASSIKVTGLPGDIPVTYTSADKKIATIDENGNIKAKKKGNTYISVSCGDLCNFTCSVTVSDGKKGMKAALQAKEFIGSAYSQEKRMQDGFFDCSSLAWRSYMDSGTAIGGSDTYAPTSANLGKYLDEEGRTISREYITPDELKPGDLIFYSSSNNGRYLNIDHVAMYYGANYNDSYYDYYMDETNAVNTGLIVHARTGGVQFSNYEWYTPDTIVLICRP